LKKQRPNWDREDHATLGQHVQFLYGHALSSLFTARPALLKQSMLPLLSILERHAAGGLQLAHPRNNVVGLSWINMSATPEADADIDIPPCVDVEISQRAALGIRIQPDC